MTPDAARGLLDLQSRDARSARRVLEHLNVLVRSHTVGSAASLSIVDETLVVVQRATVRAALLVTHIA